MPIFRPLVRRLQEYESVQTLVQAHRHLSALPKTLRWRYYPLVYRIIENLALPSHDKVHKQARALLQKGVSLGDFYLAQSLFLQNRLDDAEHPIQRFLKGAPHHSDGLYLLAQIKARQNKKQQAFDLLKNFLAHSKRGKTWQHLSNLVDNQADFERFHELFVRAYPDYNQRPLAYDLSCHLSNAGARAGDNDFVLNFWRTQYHLLCQNPPKQTANPPASRRYSDTKAAQALGDLKHCFDQKQVEFFLISGTLLGCIREGKLLGHDKDIDVGVWETHPVQDLAEAVYDSGCFHVLPIYSPHILVVRHVNGVTIDIFIHYREAEDYWHAGGKSKWHNSPFQLTPHPFLNREYLIPADYDKYLTENYGDWRTPQLSFDSALDTPNMTIISQHEFLIYLYKKITFALHSGKRPSERYLSVLREHGEHLD